MAVKEVQIQPTFAESHSVREAQVLKDDGKERRARICIIRVGPGNPKTKLFYTQEAINSGPEIFNGATFGIDHNKKLAQVQPEGTVRDIAGWIENVEADGEKLMGDAVVMPGPSLDWFWTLLKSSITFAQRHPGRNLMGISIDAKCAADGTVDMDGDQWDKIVQFTGVRRIDAVTVPGAGGMVEKIISECRDNIKEFVNRLAPVEKYALESDEQQPHDQAPTDGATIYSALMKKVRNLENTGVAGMDEVRRQLDELGTALKLNKNLEDDMEYPGQDPSASGGGPGDMGEEALTPKDHAMAATFHKNQAAMCGEAEASSGMKAHHLKMAAFHSKAAQQGEGDINITAKPHAEPDGDEPAVSAEGEGEGEGESEAAKKAKAAEAEAKAKKEAEAGKGKESNPYGPEGLKLLKEQTIAKAGLPDAHKQYLLMTMESMTDPKKIQATVEAYAKTVSSRESGGHGFQRQAGSGSKKSNLVGALESAGVLAEE
ncbi:MAG: hypothetical protein KGL39_33905 [Patescibacteria group bacterium]|nr:hypothetical protein [Patescibacteria group bacterium]